MQHAAVLRAVIVVSTFLTVPLEAGVPVQLTDSPAKDRHPTWSGDGTFIVFESNRSGEAWHLYRVDASAGPATQISFAANSQLAPEISPDGSKIVYIQGFASVSTGAMNGSAICVMPVGGGAPITLVPDDGRFRYHPTWSPDGSTIYFSLRLVPGDGFYDIYKVSASGGTESLVVDLGDEDFSQTVSPDGATLTWGSHDLGTPYNLYQAPLVNPSQSTKLTFESANTSQPDYSPDGAFIAFASRKNLGKLDIYQISLASQAITRLTFDAETSVFDPLSQFPSYSPDGQKLAFSSARVTGEENIWVLPLESAPCPVAMALNLEPNTFNLQSMASWVTAFLEPPTPYRADEIDLASIRLQGSLPIAQNAPSEIGDHDGNGVQELMVKFSRSDLELLLGSGSSVSVSITGLVAGHCFSGHDVVRIIHASVTNPPEGHSVAVGQSTSIEWNTPGGVEPQSVAVLWSHDNDSWELIEEGLPNTGNYVWAVPNTLTEKANVAIVLVESSGNGHVVEGVLGMSGVFAIREATGVTPENRTRLGLNLVSPASSARGLEVAFSLADAQPATLALYDVAGRKLASREVGGLGSGVHTARFGEVASLPSGVYVVELAQGGHRITARAALIH